MKKEMGHKFLKNLGKTRLRPGGIKGTNFLFAHIEFKKGGIMNTRAQEVLKKAADLLKTIETMGIFKTIEKGVFGGVRRPIDGGKGLAGVFEKDSTYFNPFIPLMLGGDRQ